ncbi:hypothetical protein T440DRAFT_496350 [Plenodomus tracheiphilus IPT5]|uniref:Uncharacterized protein n=1 Tax=Plenodomus tracheiphilus IPT5 TaxID=1408161 RepID=A0A6A7BFQ5_9PLEO|nr:hypothetical protein T440DRAFT_496350 [Plenodomus tracheiphilus IPT5]
MLYTISLFLFLLPLSSADLKPSSLYKNTVQRPVGCHDRFNANSEMIVFRHPSQIMFEYAIITPYKKYYPRLLQYALRANEFQFSDWQKDQECGWQKKDNAVPPNVTSDKLVFPHGDQLPSNATIDRIHQILSSNPPAGDVYELTTLLLGYATGFMVFIVLLILLKYCIEGEECYKSPNSENRMEGAELEAFRPLDTPVRTSTGRATIPSDVSKSLYHDDRNHSVWSVNTCISELPPSYSVSRADR